MDAHALGVCELIERHSACVEEDSCFVLVVGEACCVKLFIALAFAVGFALVFFHEVVDVSGILKGIELCDAAPLELLLTFVLLRCEWGVAGDVTTRGSLQADGRLVGDGLMLYGHECVFGCGPLFLGEEIIEVMVGILIDLVVIGVVGVVGVVGVHIFFLFFFRCTKLEVVWK